MTNLVHQISPSITNMKWLQMHQHFSLKCITGMQPYNDSGELLEQVCPNTRKMNQLKLDSRNEKCKSTTKFQHYGTRTRGALLLPSFGWFTRLYCKLWEDNSNLSRGCNGKIKIPELKSSLDKIVVSSLQIKCFLHHSFSHKWISQQVSQ